MKITTALKPAPMIEMKCVLPVATFLMATTLAHFVVSFTKPGNQIKPEKDASVYIDWYNLTYEVIPFKNCRL